MESAVLPEAVGPKIAMVFNEFLLHVSLGTTGTFAHFSGAVRAIITLLKGFVVKSSYLKCKG